MKKLLLILLPLMTGCATFNHKLVDWGSHEYIYTAEQQPITIVGNPRISCYNKKGRLLADGFFVRVENERCSGECATLLVDEFGKDYVHVRNDSGNYCILFPK